MKKNKRETIEKERENKLKAIKEYQKQLVVSNALIKIRL